MTHLGQSLEGCDETWDIGSRMEKGRILLRQDIAQLRIGVLWPREHRAHARMRCVQERDLIATLRVDERW